MAWFREWVDSVAPAGRRVVLVGVSGGAAFAGGLLLSDPSRYAGAAILFGTLPWDAGVPTEPARLFGTPAFVAQGDRAHATRRSRSSDRSSRRPPGSPVAVTGSPGSRLVPPTSTGAT